MLRFRRVQDAVAPANRAAIAEAQAILRAQFPGLPAADVDKLADRISEPLSRGFVTRLLVATDAGDHVRGAAVVLYAPHLNFCYLDTMAAAPGRTGGGLGAALYERVRDEARGLTARGLFFECLPDDPALSPDPDVRARNKDRLRFYEQFGARPIVNTAYETPLKPGDTNPPYLMFDSLGHNRLPSRRDAQSIIRMILESKYGAVCPPGYIDAVVASVRDDPIQLRPARYIRGEPPRAAPPQPGAARVALVVNDEHLIHNVRDRGYVESPVRIRSILGELQTSGLFVEHPPVRFPEHHIRAVHDSALVDYLERTCRGVPPEKSIYPYVFPIRNAARPPKDLGVRAGYFCIDTFTPLNANAHRAARRAVDCALTAARAVVDGAPLSYALVRPPGHHAERRAFGGFCYFNNAAIAAHYLSRYGKVAVLDVDYHHGNGTQDIFYQRADVLTVSVHGHPRFAYPYFSGFRDETGTGPGAGYNLNLPLAETITPDEHRGAIATALRRIERFAPHFLVLAIGFDTARADPTGTWSNRAADFRLLGRMIGDAGYPTVAVQEGGYRVMTLGTNARNFFVGLTDGANASMLRKPRPARGRGTAVAPEPAALSWREEVREADIEAVRALVEGTGFFTPAETAIAAELVAERVHRGPESGYEFIVADEDGRIAGYACYGPIAGTEASYDLYWIAVSRERQRGGLGRRILANAEAAIAVRGGRRIYVETSSTPGYEPTRRFYRAMGYRKAAELPDFYRPGDGKVVFAKALPPRG